MAAAVMSANLAAQEASARAAAMEATSAPSAAMTSRTGAALAFLSAAARAELLAKGSISETEGSVESLTFWRGSPFAADLARLPLPPSQTLAADSWTIVALPRSPGSGGGGSVDGVGPAAGAGSGATTAVGATGGIAARDEELALRIFRAFTAFSTMKGLKAKSAIFPGDEDFILDSSRVEAVPPATASSGGAVKPGAAKWRRLADPVVDRAPDAATFTLYGRDFLAGDVYYELRFVAEVGWYRITLMNLVTMRSLLLPLADPGDLLTVFYILPAGDEVLLFGLTAAKTPLVPGTVGLERTMLANRMIAIGKWFAGNLAR